MVVRPFFFGASLTALNKPSGGIRPIAVGCTLRRLVAKIACSLVRDDMTEFLTPRQLGFGVPNGAEAAVHAARCFLSTMSSDQALVKLDFANAFNSVFRDRMLEVVHTLALEIPLCIFCLFSSIFPFLGKSDPLFG